jgi:hypothetical protein
MSPDVGITADRRSYAAGTAAFVPVANEERRSSPMEPRPESHLPSAGLEVDTLPETGHYPSRTAHVPFISH